MVDKGGSGILATEEHIACDKRQNAICKGTSSWMKRRSRRAGMGRFSRRGVMGTLVMLPIIIGYVIFVYWMFSGKLREGEGYH